MRRFLYMMIIMLIPALVFPAGKAETVPPAITIENTGSLSFSPGNSPGVQDTLDLYILYQTDEKLVINGYSIEIEDASGNIVYQEQGEREKPPGFFENLFTGMGIQKKKAYNAPFLFSWNGKGSNGKDLEDGKYYLAVSAFDDKGNSGSSEKLEIEIDNENPELKLNFPFKVFSPNGDGHQDVFIVEQNGSEAYWRGIISDTAGNSLFVKNWQYITPGSFSWNGMQADNQPYPDGKYTYQLNGTDSAGNSLILPAESFEIDNRKRSVSISLDMAYFSPNNDGVSDTLDFIPAITIKEGMKEWRLSIISSSEKTVRTFKGYTAIPESIVFDGKADNGKLLGEDSYIADFAVFYTNGDMPSAASQPFRLDITPPKAMVKRDIDIFSPNGDGRKDQVFIQQSTSQEYTWSGEIVDAKGNSVKSYTWKGNAAEYFYWNGITDEGTLADEGIYFYVLSSTDFAGNSASIKSKSFIKNNSSTAVSLSVDKPFFNPLGEEGINSVSFQTEIPDIEILDSYSLWIMDPAENNIRRISGSIDNNKFVWNGRTDSGQVAPDGMYYGIIETEFKNGNYRMEKSPPVYIDTVHPVIKNSANDRYFSPDGDGFKDVIEILHSEHSDEEKWTAFFKNAEGKIINTINFSELPDKYIWDGKDQNGNVLDDGTYSYEISAVDPAGNKTIAVLTNITIDTKEVPLALKVDSSSFSPNGDGIKDKFVFTPQITDSKNISGWQLNIKDSGGRLLRNISGSNNPPEKIIFDGKQNSGIYMKEGTYNAEIKVTYLSGKSPTGTSPDFSIDLSSADARVKVDNPVFSPNGDGKKDTVIISQESGDTAEWNAEIRDSFGTAVKSFQWHDKIPGSVTWDGRNESGKTVNDGEYYYILESIDNAGNRSSFKSSAIIKNTQTTEVLLSMKNNSFSPNDDGSGEYISINAGLGYKTGVVSYKFSILDSKNKEVFSLSKNNAIPVEFTWNGKDSSGRTMQDGTYKAKLEVEYEHGNIGTGESENILIDTAYPEAEISTVYLLFSPDGDSNKDRITINQKTSKESLWEGEIYNNSGNLMYSEFWQGSAGDFDWSGNDKKGNVVPDGKYYYILSCTDDAGNKKIVRLDNIEVDNRKPYVYTNFSEDAFSPNGDRLKDFVDITFYASMSDNIKKWRVDIYEENYNKVVQSLESEPGQSLPPKIEWDGTASNGAVIDGLFKARLIVQYEKGNLVEVISPKAVLLDTKAPDADIKLSAQPFSPDGDGIDDELSITIIPSDDPSGIKDWNVKIYDPVGNLFRSFSGKGKPEKPVIWDGLSDDGELVQSAEDYPVVIEIRDNQNNVQIVEGYSSIDVLVIREGDKLYIRISSITFAPDSADFKNVDKEKAERNDKTIKRLAEIFKKYSNYSIIIEGHAASVYWNNPSRYEKEEKEELIPLSKARAEAVKKALVALGLPSSRITTEGIGGRQPVVPHSDTENRWKNRRVEFILIKQ